jgi:hypothetical protein
VKSRVFPASPKDDDDDGDDYDNDRFPFYFTPRHHASSGKACHGSMGFLVARF